MDFLKSPPTAETNDVFKPSFAPTSATLAAAPPLNVFISFIGAEKLVRNSENLYSFLNASYFKGNDILKFDTRHVISLIKVNDEKEELDQFIEYLLTDGQTAIKNQGFIPID